ncbi:MAG: hypothetical protein RBT69_02875 [Spirochaetia bacterium]|jgi:hypothetical protein|nr:hypothetical protein [Spirochaetia bacterium]
MTSRLNKKYYIIPFLYISVIIFLLYLQFATSKQFSENYLSINISGSARSGSRDFEKNVSRLETSMHGIKLIFSDSSPLSINENDGTVSQPSLSGYRKNPESIDILFSGNVRLTVSAADEKGINYIIKAFLPSGKKIKNISLSFDVEKNENIIKSTNFPVFGYNSEGKIYFFTAEGGGSSIDQKKGRITLFPGSKESFSAVISEASAAINDPWTFWLSKNADLETGSDDISNEKNFVELAWKNLRTVRLDTESGMWYDKNRQPVYSREIISCLGSEAFKRKEFNLNQWIFRLTGAKNSTSQYIETALINGDTQTAYRQMQSRDLELINEITLKIRNNDKTVFRIKNLVQLITDRGPYSLIQELFLAAEKLDIGKLDMETAAGAASAYLYFAEFNIEKERSIEKLNTIINQKLLDKVILIDNRLYLLKEGGKSDLIFTVKTAQLFKQAGDTAERPVLKQIGSKLISAVISLSGDDGFAPETLYTGNNRITGMEGFIEPEYIYPALESAEYLPRIHSLKNQMAPGTWIATCAKVAGFSHKEGSMSVETIFPVDETEHLIIQGIQSVSGVKLYNVNWNTAADFENYYTGWFYSSESQTLFLKLKHRQLKETIVIDF